MKTISIKVGNKIAKSKSPNVAILKEFLYFKNIYSISKSFDSEVVNSFIELLAMVFPTISKRKIESMDINEFIDAANTISDWLALAIKDAEKKH